MSRHERGHRHEHDSSNERNHHDRHGSVDDHSNHGAAAHDPVIDGGYRFDIADGQVVNLQAFDHGRWRAERIDAQEVWAFDGVSLVQTEQKRFGQEQTIFTDPDGDGVFSRAPESFL